MHQATVGISVVALLFLSALPAMAEREGVPGRRVGGGTRLAPQMLSMIHAPNW
ncbi:hypothetical protein H6F43_19755 [Leptolyngbya sp. FACHB-36]|uniref:hypothetical protein n=1 Tax=Leptolyngbya sp. FACHB-36 TaxID=2692808 RepID=UPI00199AB3B6|nr:hypothetical protein [Leptolyngbya sp. FACHB-36]MBD2022419.1 hypothetical protein [Leptolyngbya sp. FACHB-36]